MVLAELRALEGAGQRHLAPPPALAVDHIDWHVAAVWQGRAPERGDGRSRRPARELDAHLVLGIGSWKGHGQAMERS